MSEEEKSKIINTTMASESWKSEVRIFPVEWQIRVESAMAKALGHGLHEVGKADASYAVFDTLDRLYRDGFKVIRNFSDGRFVLSETGGKVVATGNTFRDLCVNIVLAGL